MDTHALEIIVSIVTTAGISVAGGWKLLDLRLAKFQNELMDRLNGTYIRRAECALIHDNTSEKITQIQADIRQLKEVL